MLPIIVFGIVFYIINTFIISIVYSITGKKGIIYSFVSNLKLVLLNTFAMTPFGILLAYLFNLYSYGGVILVLFPIILARYTFSLYIQSKSQYIQTVDALMLAMEARDKYTEGHSQRVAQISASIAKELKYNDWKIDHLNMAALLHDVVKIGIDDHILNKPGKLTVEEFDIIKTHPQIGYNILKDIKNLQNILPIVRNHHERYDGTGYPDSKKAEDLSLDVFIVISIRSGFFNIGMITYILNFIMYLLLVVFIYFNRRNKFIVLMGVGFLLNACAIFLNGGAMPVSAKAAETAGITLNVTKEGLYTLINENTKLWFLGDIIPKTFLRNFAISIGDIIAVVGLMLFVITGMKKTAKN